MQAVRTQDEDLTIFLQYLGECRRRTPEACADTKVLKDAPHRELSDATLRLDLALGVRHGHAPES